MIDSGITDQRYINIQNFGAIGNQKVRQNMLDLET